MITIYTLQQSMTSVNCARDQSLPRATHPRPLAATSY